MSGIDSLGLPPLHYGRALEQPAPAEETHAPEGELSPRSWFGFDEWNGLDAVISIAGDTVDRASGATAGVVHAPQNHQNREDASSNMMGDAHQQHLELGAELTEQQQRWRSVERAPAIGEMTGQILSRVAQPR